MSAKRKKMKPFTGWAIANRLNRMVTIAKAPMVYGTKRDAWLDKEDGDRIARVEIRETGR